MWFSFTALLLLSSEEYYDGKVDHNIIYCLHTIIFVFRLQESLCNLISTDFSNMHNASFLLRTQRQAGFGWPLFASAFNNMCTWQDTFPISQPSIKTPNVVVRQLSEFTADIPLCQVKFPPLGCSVSEHVYRLCFTDGQCATFYPQASGSCSPSKLSMRDRLGSSVSKFEGSQG